MSEFRFIHYDACKIIFCACVNLHESHNFQSPFLFRRMLLPRVLIVYHSRTNFAKCMAKALEKGAAAASAEMHMPLIVERRRARGDAW